MTESGPNAHPESIAYDDVGAEERELPAPSTIETIVAEFLHALPEVRGSLLSAADSLLDAARALLDAAERVLHQGDESETPS
jgi:hypothetical protein